MDQKKLVLGVDLDNVLCLTDPLLRRLIQRLFGVTLKQSEITEFDYWRCGITKHQNDIVLDRFHKRQCLRVGPVEGAIESLRVLAGLYEIYVVTSRPVSTKALTAEWLRTHEVGFRDVIYSQCKHDAPMGFDVFIEDHRETAYSMASGDIRSLLLDYPWNQPNPVDPPNLIRVKDWGEIREHLGQPRA